MTALLLPGEIQQFLFLYIICSALLVGLAFLSEGVQVRIYTRHGNSSLCI